MLISFIIPCYRSYNTIKQVVNEIVSTIKSQQGYDYQIILVNDGSPDKTFEAINEICSVYPKVIGINLARNFGQQNARMAALPFVDGDIVFLMDDDGQHPADGIFKMLNKLEEGHDIVYAHFKEKKHSLQKQIFSKINRIMTEVLIGKPKGITQSSFVAFRRFVADELLNYKSSFPYIFGYTMQITSKLANVELEHRERIDGKSNYTFRKMLSVWLNGFTSFSVIPLRMASYMGFFTAAIGFIYGVYIIFRKLISADYGLLGWPSIMATILFIGGMIMMMLGMLGEYVGRIFISSNMLPQYVIRETVNSAKKMKNEGKVHACSNYYSQ